MFGTQYGIEFTRLEFLWLMIGIPFIIWFFVRSLVDFTVRQRIFSLITRLLITLLLILSLAGLTFLSPTKELFVIFAVDQSKSVGKEAKESINEFLESSVKESGSHRYQYLSFAQKPSKISNKHSEIDPEEDINGTDISQVIKMAKAGIPPHYVPRIVLISDGNETSGNALEASIQGNVPVYTIALDSNKEPELQVSDVSTPTQVAQGEPFYIEVVINSNVEQEAQVEIFRGDHKVIEETKKIEKGENRFRFKQSIDRERLAEFSVTVKAKKDTILDNNSASGLVFASGKPKVLLIATNPETARHLEWALEEEGIIVDTRPPQGIPDSLSDLQNYETLMLSNVPATKLSTNQMEVIRSYVSDLGGGFVMLGGDQSFGLGGYYKTVIEEVLPVRSDFEKEKEKPSLAMVIVIDKSGSMGGQKIELAKDAAASAVELLGPRDQIGVIVFEGSSYWASEIRSRSAKSSILSSIQSIEAGGGTNMYPAMEMAFNSLQSVTAKLKHVIILTDGISSPGDFQGISQSMASARITVSTVGVGEGADQAMLEGIAKTGHGRYYFTNDPQSIPQIFTKETMTASKSAINEEPFIPQVIRPTQVLSDIDFESAPFLLGYITTRPKATSEIILGSETGDPLLAWWRYGLGMSVAFTSDANNRWAAEWLTWPGYSRFWAQLVRHVMRKSGGNSFSVDIARNDQKARIEIDSVDLIGGFLNKTNTEIKLIDPQLKKKTISLAQFAPGKYQSTIDIKNQGSYHLEITQKLQGEVVNRQSRGLIVGYPDELKLKPTNKTLLETISKSTKGVYNPTPADVFKNEQEMADRATPLWPYLVVASLFLLILDVALRRIDFSLFG
jgi:Ca-activated chloride channel homolog